MHSHKYDIIILLKNKKVVSMQVQKSFRNDNPKLYLVSTPIGNLDDMTFRAITTLRSVDVIFAEDTRVSGKLLSHFEIKKTLESYHEHNKISRGDKIIEYLKNGKNVALISDAGMPCISDPGFEIVVKAIENEFDVVPIPGANAALSALIASGISPQQFLFYGFLDRNTNKKKKQLENLIFNPTTIIFYEAPHRIYDTLETIYNVFGNRYVVIAREITKKYEEFIRGKISDVIDQALDLKGEIVLIVAPTEENEENIWWRKFSIIEHIEFYMEDGNTNKEAIKQVAKDRGLAKNEVYKIFHQI